MEKRELLGKKAYIVCPVRGASPTGTENMVRELEDQGYEVHWPHRDTNQEGTGLEICKQNAEAIRASDEIYVIWDGKSQGCLFDLGIAFALGSHGGTLTDTIAATSKAKDDLGEEHVRLFLDYINLHLVGEDPLQAVDVFYDHMILVRVQARLAREKRQVPLGEGDVDDRQVLTRLKEKGYQGFVSLKYHAADDVWDKLAQGVEFVQSI